MAIITLQVILSEILKCGACDDVLIQVSDPSLLVVNDGVPVEEIKTFIRGSVVEFSEVTLPGSCEIVYQYTLSYDDQLLLDPLTPLRACDIARVCCADCVIDYLDESPTEHFISSPACGTLRLTKPDLTFDDVLIETCVNLPITGTGVPLDPLDILISADAGNILSLGGDSGLFASPHVVIPPETVTTLVDNSDNTFTYTSEDATVTNFDVAHTLSEPVPNTVRLTRPDGSFDDVAIVGAAETITTLVDNANDTFTYTSEDATVTIFDAQHDLSRPNGTTFRLTRPGGSTNDVTVTDTTTVQAIGFNDTVAPYAFNSAASYTSDILGPLIVNAPALRDIICDVEIGMRPSYVFEPSELSSITIIIEVRLDGGAWTPITTQVYAYDLPAGVRVSRPELHNERVAYTILAGAALTIEARFRIISATPGVLTSRLDALNGSIGAICMTV